MMIDDPLEAVFSMVERAFIRLQAGDVLGLCLEEIDMAPMQKLVEGLVLAGPQSLNALREIQAEASLRKTEMQSEIARLFEQLENKLDQFGVNLSVLPNRFTAHSVEPVDLGWVLHKQGVIDPDRQLKCFELIETSKGAMSQLARQIFFLEEVEGYLDDWIWGLMYQSAHQIGLNGTVQSDKIKHCH